MENVLHTRIPNLDEIFGANPAIPKYSQTNSLDTKSIVITGAVVLTVGVIICVVLKQSINSSMAESIKLQANSIEIMRTNTEANEIRTLQMYKTVHGDLLFMNKELNSMKASNMAHIDKVERFNELAQKILRRKNERKDGEE